MGGPRRGPGGWAAQTAQAARQLGWAAAVFQTDVPGTPGYLAPGAGCIPVLLLQSTRLSHTVRKGVKVVRWPGLAGLAWPQSGRRLPPPTANTEEAEHCVHQTKLGLGTWDTMHRCSPLLATVMASSPIA